MDCDDWIMYGNSSSLPEDQERNNPDRPDDHEPTDVTLPDDNPEASPDVTDTTIADPPVTETPVTEPSTNVAESSPLSSAPDNDVIPFTPVLFQPPK